MKKLTSVVIAGMLVTAGCAGALSVSADDSQKATIKVVDSSAPSEVTTYDAYVGDKIECVISGYSQEAVTSVLTSTYINQADIQQTVEYSDINVLGYADGYYGEGEAAAYYTSDFNGYAVRPESADEYDRDVFGFCYIHGQTSGDYASENGQVMVKFAMEVLEPGECVIYTDLKDVTYDNAEGEIESSLEALKTKTTLTVIPSEERPTDEPTEEPTDEPTQTPTEEPTDIPTSATQQIPTETPTSATTPTPTQAGTVAPTSAPTSANTPSNNNSSNTNSGNTSYSAGKVATGESAAAVIFALCAALATGSVLAFARKRVK